MATKRAYPPRFRSAVDKLSAYDDFCTDLLIDKVVFWSWVHKMEKRYKGIRRVSDREVLNIIRDMVREGTTLVAAEKLVQYIPPFAVSDW